VLPIMIVADAELTINATNAITSRIRIGIRRSRRTIRWSRPTRSSFAAPGGSKLIFMPLDVSFIYTTNPPKPDPVPEEPHGQGECIEVKHTYDASRQRAPMGVQDVLNVMMSE
jgi:hypothetical protein